MADIFLSYSSADRDRVLPLVEALQDDGFTVWWDRDIRPGPSFDREIEQAIDAADCLVVVWSANSVESEWVRSEVEEGVRRGILVPVLIEEVMPPLAYRRRQSADLSGWNGERNGSYLQLLEGIRAVIAGAGEATGAVGTHGSQHAAPQRRRRRIPLGLAVFLGILSTALAGAGGWFLSQQASSGDRGPAVARLEISLPQGLMIAGGIDSKVNITPDGQTITFVARGRSSDPAYFVRKLSDFTSRSIDVSAPSVGSHWLSPDGQTLVFNDSDASVYRKTSLAGGPSTEVTATFRDNSSGIRGLSMNRDGQIAFASTDPGISLVTAPGATPEQLTTPDEGFEHSQPHFFRDGTALLFTEEAEGSNSPVVKVLDRSSGLIRKLTPGDRPRVTASGHLVIQRKAALWAAAFDSDTLSLLGEPVIVLEGLDPDSPSFSIADNGTLVYIPELPESDRKVELVWASREGQVELVTLPLDSIEMPRISPDGESILLHARVGSEDNWSIWNHSLTKETTTKLSFEEGAKFSVGPSWDRGGNHYIYTQLDGSGGGEVLLGSADGARAPLAISEGAIPGGATLGPDGHTVIVVSCPRAGTCDIARSNTAPDDTSLEVLLETPFNEHSPELSPDGKWLAYSSDESGQHEVYVRPYPELESRRWQMSANGGEVPFWSKDGTRLLFVQRSSNELMEAQVSSGEQFNWTAPASILNLETYDWAAGPRDARSFDISNDGERFLLIRQQNRVNRLMVVLNWLEEVKKLAKDRK